MDGGGLHQGSITCASWIRRPENRHLVVLGKKKSGIEIFSFDSKTTSLSSSPKAKYAFEDNQDVVGVAVHPSGDDIVCSSTNGCILLELYGQEENLKMLTKDLPPLQDAGLQKCLVFSADGSRFATGGQDGHLRVFEWPSLRILLDEPRAHKSFRDLDISLDSEFLASTSTDGSARIWKIDEGVPLTSLTHGSDEKIECCRFSRDGTKPFLFCTVREGGRMVTAVWDISTWNKIGHKKLLRKPISILSTSMDGKYLAYGSNDGDLCVVEVKKMEICHLSKNLHLGTCISSTEFCPSERFVLSTSSEWGAVVTKLDLKEWKEWQIYMLLLGLFLISAVLFYIFFQKSDSFWNFPLGRDQPAKPSYKAIFRDPQASDDQSVW
ncbi:SEC12-like protein 1 [Magnolia sinica]|uniref:SEC12-like protein 1 n=1 Tax=Magnolia sinica TaxID=86752 RepID=UPI00265ACEE9|nr:SEC12-like protein 1 [Magnolia sinica]